MKNVDLLPKSTGTFSAKFNKRKINFDPDDFMKVSYKQAFKLLIWPPSCCECLLATCQGGGSSFSGSSRDVSAWVPVPAQKCLQVVGGNGTAEPQPYRSHLPPGVPPARTGLGSATAAAAPPPPAARGHGSREDKRG